MMALAAGIALESTRASTRLATLGLLALMVPPFVFTLSRASYLGVIPVLGVLAALSRRRVLLSGLLVTALVSTIAATSLMGDLVPAAVVHRVVGTFQPEPHQPTVRLGDIGLDPSASERIIDMQRALEGWQQRPLFGWGVTGFGFVDGQYTRILVETGVVGLAAFAWLVAALLGATLTSLRSVSDPGDRGLVLGFLAGVAGLLTHAVATNTFIIVRIMEPFWFVAAIVVTLPKLPRADTSVHA
jgi:O-antigen ligase